MTDKANRRWPRVAQKGVGCSVAGCDNWRTSNDLCSKHNMAKRRYGSIYGKPLVLRICKGCGKEFKSKKDDADYCNARCYCSTPENKIKRLRGQERWKQRNYVKAKHLNNLGRKTVRHFPDKEPCIRLGCDVEGERHHPNYSRPYEIVWLCRDHHKWCHCEGTEGDFDILQIRKSYSWEKIYLRQQEGFCFECGASLKGLELFVRGLGRNKALFCSLDCINTDYLRASKLEILKK